MKPVVSIITILLFFLLSSMAFAEYWGSRAFNKYHRTDCEWALKIAPSNKIIFKTPEAAKKKGYRPCRVCNPPETSKQNK